MPPRPARSSCTTKRSSSPTVTSGSPRLRLLLAQMLPTDKLLPSDQYFHLRRAHLYTRMDLQCRSQYPRDTTCVSQNKKDIEPITSTVHNLPSTVLSSCISQLHGKIPMEWLLCLRLFPMLWNLAVSSQTQSYRLTCVTCENRHTRIAMDFKTALLLIARQHA